MSQHNKYQKREIIQMCEEASREMNTFYSQAFVNYRSQTMDSRELISEVISGYLCEHIELFDKITCITREKSYVTSSHQGIYDDESNREEEKTAMKIYDYCQQHGDFPCVGRILDYQTPLKNKLRDKAGKIDLLSVIGDTMFILELKKRDSSETMLRCALEGYTYLRTVNRDKLVADFELSDIKNFRAAPLVYKNSCQWEDLQLDADNRNLKTLMSRLGIKAYYLTEYGSDYYISED